MKLRTRWQRVMGGCALLLATNASSRAHAASSTVLVAAPEIDRDKGELVVLVGAARPDGTPARVENATLLFNDVDAGPAVGDDAITDYASEHPRWAPPIAIGLVYLWAKGGPETVMDGIESLFKHVPGRVTVYPTPYGQGYRPVLTRLTAARAAGGDLVDLPPLVGDQYKLIEAVRFNASKLAEDESAIKHLVIITDGIDFAEHDARGFALLGEELRKKKLHVELVWLRPQADAEQAAASVRALSEAARAHQISADSPGDLRAMTESLADTLVGLRRLRFALPWTSRVFGGVKRVGVAASIDGTSMKAHDGSVVVPVAPGTVVGILLALLAAAGVGAVVVFGVGRGGRRSGKLQPLLDELQHLVRLGTSADAAVVQLSQKFPDQVERLRTLELGKLDPEKYRYLRTRAGQARIKEMQKQLEDSEAEPLVDSEVAGILSKAMTSGVEPQEAARQIKARVSDDRWSALSRARDHNLNESLARAANDFAPLQAPQAAHFASDVRAALRSRDGAQLSVAWFARATGPGRRGETLAINGSPCVVGRAVECTLRLTDDPQLADRHAEIHLSDGEFKIRSVGGRVTVDERDVTAQQALSDGVVVGLGSSRYVFKCVVER
jgi:hypothetical protein